MGDTGSLLLGYLIAFLGLKFYSLNVSGEFFRINAAPAVFLGVVSVPVFDVVRVFVLAWRPDSLRSIRIAGIFITSF